MEHREMYNLILNHPNEEAKESIDRCIFTEAFIVGEYIFDQKLPVHERAYKTFKEAYANALEVAKENSGIDCIDITCLKEDVKLNNNIIPDKNYRDLLITVTDDDLDFYGEDWISVEAENTELEEQTRKR